MSAPATSQKLSARDRLLDAADELFYGEGVHTVGIDRVIERAGVAKASLYSAFGSKDELIRQYLLRRNARWRDRLTEQLEARFDNPRDRLLGVFEVQGEAFGTPGFNGCAFANASAETRQGSLTEGACDEYRSFMRGTFAELAREAGAPDPQALAGQLALVYDGAATAARMDRCSAPGVAARTIAATLVDAAFAG